MAQFQPNHSNYLSHAMGHRYRSNDPNFEQKLRELRGALYDKDATKYFSLTKELNVCTCELCGLVIGDATLRGTGLCDGCWELNSRIDCASTLNKWAQMSKGRERLQEVLQVLQAVLASAPEPPVDSPCLSSSKSTTSSTY
jgi:hypothetical protein